ncbi:hypothetical protein BCR33DRAFT_324973 [Rhizoclosmatium globosum]|uniref:G-protein coupled receptors family 1 profile domain-containing protein n=1 Tax=Rhizoclosmatium globosum TaxID=329046 RepID=A0A1Y2D0D0_9FUNG|nr:hypothetical protein BCR33DRAFT_324973 [Rhizoclosmatium globosum]|eukprot:ORY52657.1 hypothetical protein BCR33DRAFT_324973 [Rhizoclosmatium globosum]
MKLVSNNNEEWLYTIFNQTTMTNRLFIPVPVIYYSGILLNTLVLTAILRRKRDTLWTQMGKLMTCLILLFLVYSIGMAVLWTCYVFFDDQEWVSGGPVLQPILHRIYGGFR